MRILLAFDGSPESVEAAEFLSLMPLPLDSEVTVATVLDDTHFDEVDPISGLTVREVSVRTAQADYQKVDRIFEKRGFLVKHLLREGHPNRELLAVAKAHTADLMVLGARGHSMIARTLLGSTSDYVANQARCPVLIVRPRTDEQKSRGHLRVVLGYDGSAGSKVAAAQLFRWTWPASTEVQITTLLERPAMLPEDVVYDEEAVATAEKSLHELVTDCQCAANVSYKVRESTHVGSSLSHLAETEHGDLIFVGDTGKSAIAAFFLGSASRHVIHHAPCSVYIARPVSWHG